MALSYNQTKDLLDSLYVKYNCLNSSEDPVWNLHKVNSELDKEILAFITTCYSYGNISQINKFIQKVLNYSSSCFADFILSDKEVRKIKKFNFNYRFNTSADFFDLLFSISKVIKKYGSLKLLFLKYYKKDDSNVIKALYGFTSEIRSYSDFNKSFGYLLPDVNRKSACKRLFLFLRWMVRKDNVDLGLWNDVVDTSKLIFPVDTHVYKIALEYNFVKRKSLDINFALELTEKLKEYDPIDPVKYDFALCHLGVDKYKF